MCFLQFNHVLCARFTGLLEDRCLLLPLLTGGSLTPNASFFNFTSLVIPSSARTLPLSLLSYLCLLAIILVLRLLFSFIRLSRFFIVLGCDPQTGPSFCSQACQAVSMHPIILASPHSEVAGSLVVDSAKAPESVLVELTLLNESTGEVTNLSYFTLRA